MIWRLPLLWPFLYLTKDAVAAVDCEEPRNRPWAIFQPKRPPSVGFARGEENFLWCEDILHTLEAMLWGQGRLTAFLEMKKKDGMENLESFCNNLDGDKEWGCWETKKRPWKFGIGLFTGSLEGQMVLGRILMNLESQWLINTRIYEYLRQKN